MAKEDNTLNRWWVEADKETTLESLNGAIQKVVKDTLGYRNNCQFHWQLYRGQIKRGNGIYDLSSHDITGEQDHFTLNVVKSIVDTIVSKISANKPRPRFLTSGGSWNDYEKAKKLTKFIDGQFYHSKIYELAPQAFIDACIFGTGILKIYEDNLDVKVEKILPQELLVSVEEAVYGEPHTMHQIKKIHREVLKEMYPDFIEDIEGLPSTVNEGDMVNVRCSWKKAVKRTIWVDGEKTVETLSGKYITSIETAILEEYDYEKEYFPFVIFRWTELSMGFFGAGIAEEIADIQIQLNNLISIAQDSIVMTEIPKILVDNNSEFDVKHVDDEVGTILGFTGTPPVFLNVGSTSEILLSQIENLYRKAYEIIGVSQLAANSRKPAGLDSGVALREFNDIESERFYDAERRYESTYNKAGYIMIDLVKDIIKENPAYNVNVPGRDFLETVKFKDVNLSEDRYKMEMFSAAFLPRTPAGRLQAVQELIDRGFLGVEQGLELIQYPDVQGALALRNADFNLIQTIIDRMAFKGEYMAPEPYFNIQLGLEWIQKAYMEFKMKNLPEDRQALFRRWMDDAEALLNPPIVQEANAAQEAIAADEADLLQREAGQPGLDDLVPIEGPQ